jgi:hypothetical protein
MRVYPVTISLWVRDLRFLDGTPTLCIAGSIQQARLDTWNTETEEGSLQHGQFWFFFQWCSFFCWHYLQTSAFRCHSLWTMTHMTGSSSPGTSRPSALTGSASLVPLVLRLAASWTKQLLVSLSHQLADSHCGTYLASDYAAQANKYVIIIYTFYWFCSSEGS